MAGSISSRKLLNAITDWIIPAYEKEEARSIAFMILEKVFMITHRDIISSREISLNHNDILHLNEILQRLIKNEPIQYILGEAFFYDRWFIVNPAVLVPRPETEELCRLIIRENQDPGLRILDIGTGSGCIAIVLALNLIAPEIHAWDISQDAIVTARANARKFGIDIEFKVLDLFSITDYSSKFDIIVCNPPYVIADDSVHMRRNVLYYEPGNAIFVNNEDPLIYYRKILYLREKLLTLNGKIYFEINESFGQGMNVLLKENHMHEVRIIRDIHGKERFATAKL